MRFLRSWLAIPFWISAAIVTAYLGQILFEELSAGGTDEAAFYGFTLGPIAVVLFFLGLSLWKQKRKAYAFVIVLGATALLITAGLALWITGILNAEECQNNLACGLAVGILSFFWMFVLSVGIPAGVTAPFAYYFMRKSKNAARAKRNAILYAFFLLFLFSVSLLALWPLVN